MFIFVFNRFLIIQTVNERETSKQTQNVQIKRRTCKTSKDDLTWILNGGKLGFVGNTNDVDLNHNSKKFSCA